MKITAFLFLTLISATNAGATSSAKDSTSI